MSALASVLSLYKGGAMAFANIERFTVLLELAEKIAGRYADQDLIITRAPDGRWSVSLGPQWIDGIPPKRDGYTDKLETALEAFVTSPRNKP